MLVKATPAFAQLPPTPSPSVTPGASSTISKSDANATISTVNNFVTSTDKLLGGFIFFTPDVFADKITLKDGTVIPGLSTYRDIFYAISIPVVAISIAFFALRRLRDETPFAYKTLLTKLFFVAILFIATPTLLSYSIQANNLLVQKITSDQKFSQFVTSFLDNEQKQIQNGADPQQFGLPTTQPSFLGGMFQSLWQFILQSALFLIALFFFIIGFLFITFQFIIRFASLLFLSVLFPIAIPFALSEKTEGITNNYFKTWFMFLIHQPAFALGYMIASGFLTAILSANGASLGMLFFYSGFLFFLGGVNTLVSHVFGSSWTALGANIGAGMLTAPFGKSFNEFKKGAITGNATGLRSLAGRELGKRIGFVKPKNKLIEDTNQNSSSTQQIGNQGNRPRQYVPRKDLASLLAQANAPKSTTTSVVNNQKHTAHVPNDTDTTSGKKAHSKTPYATKSNPQSDRNQPSQLQPTKVDNKHRVKELLLDDKKFQQKEINRISTKNRDNKRKIQL